MVAATELGPLASFVGYWVPMMAAMMLPGAVPAVVRRARVQSVPLFLGSYLAVWTLVGLAVYAVYRPHGSLAAGALTVAAGLYELTSVKRACRRRCQESVRSGLEFGVFCVGSSIGLMLMLVALGVISITWMSLIAASSWRRSLCLSIEPSTCRSHWPSWLLESPLAPTSDKQRRRDE